MEPDCEDLVAAVKEISDWVRNTKAYYIGEGVMTVKLFLNKAAEIERIAVEEFNDTIEKAEAKFKLHEAEAAGIRMAAQDVCSHESVTTVHWTEDGAFPNEPRSRVDCTICGKQGVINSDG